MYPILFSFRGINIYTHGLMIAIGAMLGGLLMYYLAKKNGYRTNFLFDLIVYALLFGLIGSRILYVILYFNQFANFKEMFFIWYGGLVSFGGILGGLIFAWIYLRAKGENVLRWFDLGIIGLMVGWAFGRIGCLLNNDSYGIMNASKIAIWGRIPTQIFESIWVIMVAAVCFLVFRNKLKYSLPNGLVFLLGIDLYSLGRFVIDFWRDEPIFFIGLKLGQIGSMMVAIITSIIIFSILKEIKKRNQHGSV